MIHLTVLLCTRVSAESLLDKRCGESVIFRLIFSMFSGDLEVLGLFFCTFMPTEPLFFMFFTMSRMVFLSGAFFSLLLVVQPELLLQVEMTLRPFPMYQNSSFS